MSELNYIPEVDTDEYGQPIEETAPFKYFRPNYSWECANDKLSTEVMINFYQSKGLALPTVKKDKGNKVMARCGIEIWPKNLEAHQIHCPRCKGED